MTIEELKKLNVPDTPGVYMFLGSGKKILYIGKATSLKDRVRSYFANDIGEVRSSAIAGMVARARTLAWEQTDSVLEALILEANLIKLHQPQYNVKEKDNKSFNYLVITKEDFPRVLVVRGRELFGHSLKTKNYKLKTIFGPYPQGRALVDTLKIVRKIFPYRDTCVPCAVPQKSTLSNSRELESVEVGKNPRNPCKKCFNAQIGLCPGVCSGEMDRTEYGHIIRRISRLFLGQMRMLKLDLVRDMQIASKKQEFEKAEELRRQVSALEHIRDVSLITDERAISTGGPNSMSVRIEAYDVAHTAGSETVGVMTVVENGEANKNEYRKFKIQSATNDDIASLREVLSRRLAHPEWQLPKIIVVDGAHAQLHGAMNVLKDAGVIIPIVGVVKNEFHKPERLIGDKKSIETHEKAILLANNEAHRFAIGYHRKRSRKALLA